MESILKEVTGVVAELTRASLAKTRTVLLGVDLRMSGSYDGLCVAVGDRFSDTLTRKIRIEVRIDGHLGNWGASQ